MGAATPLEPGAIVGYAATYARTRVAGVVTETRDVPLSTYVVERQARVRWKARGREPAMSPWLPQSALIILRGTTDDA